MSCGGLFNETVWEMYLLNWAKMENNAFVSGE